ncbi:MAG: NAD-dependent succinate-semialdehyde dehydrogenase, partial [Candidatus Roizmanbacteria bacterium]|nr:NAD-dependent succinate-semialdehyde dehydrogenase [Candidatus Roizmanbacteria bacterium]
INPATEEVLAEFPVLTKNQLEEKIDLSASTFEQWKKVSFSKKKYLMKRASVILLKEKEKLARTITLEMGKTIRESLMEVEKCAVVCNYFAEQAENIVKKEIIKTEAKESYIRFDPIGIIFAIMPWNFPFWQVFRAAAPALMVGNTMLLKHASNVPQSSQLIEKIFLEAGFPKGSFQNLLIDTSMSKEVINHKYVRAVTLTGSEQAGSIVAATAGAAIKKTILELGGSDPFIILDDADIKKAAQMATSSRLIVTGQSCIAAKRFIVNKKVADEFLKEFKRLFEEKKVGDPLSLQTDVGSLSSKQILKTIEKQVDDSVKVGAKIVTGGKKMAGKGYFYLPTILINVTNNMPVYHEETFGPVAVVFVVKDDSEAIKIANDTKYGLGASVWTKSKKRSERFIEELESGSVFINSIVKSDPRLPFGGIKMSGYGRELSSYGLKEFVNIKTVVMEN